MGPKPVDECSGHDLFVSIKTRLFVYGAVEQMELGDLPGLKGLHGVSGGRASVAGCGGCRSVSPATAPRADETVGPVRTPHCLGAGRFGAEALEKLRQQHALLKLNGVVEHGPELRNDRVPACRSGSSPSEPN